jgi:hypothetical protein
MDNTTKQFIYFENQKFYALTPAGKHQLGSDELTNMKSGYVLVISDSELFYTTMEFPDAPKRKLDVFISNYLQGTFPGQLCSRFCYQQKNDKILIGIFSASFDEFFQENAEVFSKAAYITSPLSGVYSENDTFGYIAGGLPLTVQDGIIVNTAETEQVLSPDMAPALTAKLVVPFVKNMSSSLNVYRIPAAVLLACFLVFCVGDYFRLKAYKDKLAQAELALENIYKKAGVAGKRDPYGMLLGMAGGDETGDTYRTLFLLEVISKSSNENITAETLDIKLNNVTIQGTSTDYTFLEEFQKSLADNTKKNVSIVDTVKKDEGISFTLRLDI